MNELVRSAHSYLHTEIYASHRPI